MHKHTCTALHSLNQYVPALQTGYLYSRWGNPTVDAAADTLARMEGAAGSLLFSSGMAAIVTSMLTFLKTGDHMVSLRSITWWCMLVYNKKLLSSVPCDVLDILLLPLLSLFFPSPPLSFFLLLLLLLFSSLSFHSFFSSSSSSWPALSSSPFPRFSFYIPTFLSFFLSCLLSPPPSPQLLPLLSYRWSANHAMVVSINLWPTTCRRWMWSWHG